MTDLITNGALAVVVGIVIALIISGRNKNAKLKKLEEDAKKTAVSKEKPPVQIEVPAEVIPKRERVKKEKQTPLFLDFPPPTLPPLHLLKEPEYSSSIKSNQDYVKSEVNPNEFIKEVEDCELPADELTYFFEIGKNYSCLVGGGVGSGKSTFLHNVICTTALNYSPNEVELLLVDLKEGTEFSPYSKLPHTKVLATASDVTMGLSVLEFIDQEIKRRGAVFKKHGCKDFTDFKQKTGDVMPRWLVIMDEFQTLFYEHAISRQAESLLDNLVRKGRSFGINFILSTQSLLGVNILESTLSQLGIRVVFRMQERDAGRFLAADNTMPSTFKAPGIAVFNDNNGDISANKIVKTFPISSDVIGKVVSTLQDKYKEVSERFILDGSSFDIIPEQEPSPFSSSSIDISPGVPLNLSEKNTVVRINKKFPERLCVIGNNDEKWLAITRSFIYQFYLKNPKVDVKIFDFSGKLKQNELPQLEEGRIQLISNHDQINDEIEKILAELTTAKFDGNQLIIFYDLGMAREFKRKIKDPTANIDLENQSQTNAINLILNSQSTGIQLSLFTKRLSHLDDTFRKEYDNPISSRLFEYQLVVDNGDTFDIEMDTLSEYNAYLFDNVVGTRNKIILCDIEDSLI